MESDEALEKLHAQLISMNAPVELRTKIMATASTCEDAYISAACAVITAALQWMDSVTKAARPN